MALIIIDEPVVGSARPCFDDVISGSDVLRNVMEYLDESSLKACRRVSQKWEDEARRVLMKKFELNVKAWNATDMAGLEKFSSWKLDLRGGMEGDY
jgi:hypothetical protein